MFNGVVGGRPRRSPAVTSVHPGHGLRKQPADDRRGQHAEGRSSRTCGIRPSPASTSTDTTVALDQRQVPSHEGDRVKVTIAAPYKRGHPAPRAAWHLEHAVHQQFGDPMNRLSTDRPPWTRRDDGQIIVIFALAARRHDRDGRARPRRRLDLRPAPGQQNAADLAATGCGQPVPAHRRQDRGRPPPPATIATQNGFDPHGRRTRQSSRWASNDTRVKVNISAPHQQQLRRRHGLRHVARVDRPRRSRSASPTPRPAAGRSSSTRTSSPIRAACRMPMYSDPDHPFTFGDGNGDVPNDPNDIAWTCYGTCGNVDSATVRAMVDGTSPISDHARPDRGLHAVHRPGRTTATTPPSSARSTPSWPGRRSPCRSWTTTGSSRAGRRSTSSARTRATRPSPGYFVSPFDKNTKPSTSPAARARCPKPRYIGTYVLQLVD